MHPACGSGALQRLADQITSMEQEHPGSSLIILDLFSKEQSSAMNCTNTDSILRIPPGTETHCQSITGMLTAPSPIQLLNTYLLPTPVEQDLRSTKPRVNSAGRLDDDVMERTDTNFVRRQCRWRKCPNQDFNIQQWKQFCSQRKEKLEFSRGLFLQTRTVPDLSCYCRVLFILSYEKSRSRLVQSSIY